MMLANYCRSAFQVNVEDYAGFDLPFADADALPEWAANAIKFAYASKLINGKLNTADGLVYYKPADTLTRAEITVILGRLLLRDDASAAPAMTDEALLPDWAVYDIRKSVAQEVAWLYDDGAFRHGDKVSRAETARMFFNMYGKSQGQLWFYVLNRNK